MEELRKDVECTSQVMPHALASGHPHQVAAAAAVAASVLASRNAAAAAVAVSKYNSAALDLHHHHRSISAPHLNSSGSLPAGITSGFSGISETGSSTSLISPRSPPDSALIGQACENSRSPPIRVTDSDGQIQIHVVLKMYKGFGAPVLVLTSRHYYYHYCNHTTSFT